MLSAGFVAFFLVYLGNAYSYVGRIDGLPPLPEAYWPDPVDKVVPAAAPRTPNLTEKIKMAFGQGAKELKCPIRLDLHSRPILPASDYFSLRYDGPVCLTPLCVAL